MRAFVKGFRNGRIHFVSGFIREVNLHLGAVGLAAVNDLQTVGTRKAVHIVVTDAVPSLAILVEHLAVHPHDGTVLDALEYDVAVAGGTHGGTEAQIALSGAAFAFVGLHQRSFRLLRLLLNLVNGEGDRIARRGAVAVHFDLHGHIIAAVQLIAIVAHSVGIGADAVLARLQRLALLEQHRAVRIGIVDHDLHGLRGGLLRLGLFGFFRVLAAAPAGPLVVAVAPIGPLRLLRLGLFGLFRVLITAPAGPLAAVAAPVGPLRLLRLGLFRLFRVLVATPARPLAAIVAPVGPLIATIAPVGPSGLFSSIVLGRGHGNGGYEKRIAGQELPVHIDLDLRGGLFLRRLRIRGRQTLAAAGDAGEPSIRQFINHQTNRRRKRFLRHGCPIDRVFTVQAGFHLHMLHLAICLIIQRNAGQHVDFAGQRRHRHCQLAQQHQQANHQRRYPFEPASKLDHVCILLVRTLPLHENRSKKSSPVFIVRYLLQHVNKIRSF